MADTNVTTPNAIQASAPSAAAAAPVATPSAAASAANTPAAVQPTAIDPVRAAMEADAKAYREHASVLAAAREAGLTSPEDVRAAANLAKASKAAGVDQATLAAILDGRRPAQPVVDPVKPGIPASIKDEVYAAMAVFEHQKAASIANELERSVSETIQKAIPQDRMTPELKRLAEMVAQNAVIEVEGYYPKGHPLAGQVMPLTSAQAEAAKQKASALLSAVVGAAAKPEARPSLPQSPPSVAAGNVPQGGRMSLDDLLAKYK